MSAVRVVLVEDNVGDVELIRLGFKRIDADVQMEVIGDGQQAANYFRTLADTPDIILLDLNLPKVNGFDLIAHIRANDRTRLCPVVVLSSSTNPRNIAHSFDAHLAGYIAKPDNALDFLSAIEKLFAYWFSAVTLPHN